MKVRIVFIGIYFTPLSTSAAALQSFGCEAKAEVKEVKVNLR